MEAWFVKKGRKSWVQGCENGPISLSRTPLITTAGVLCEGVPGDGGGDRAEGILGRTWSRTFKLLFILILNCNFINILSNVILPE